MYYVHYYYGILTFLLNISLIFYPIANPYFFNRQAFDTLRSILFTEVKPEDLRIFYKHIH